MSWTDIEKKWAAMTRRIGADRTQYDKNPVIAHAPQLPPLLGALAEMHAPSFLERSDT